MATTLEYHESGLPKNHRFITDHDSSGKAIFNTTIDEAQPRESIGNGATFSLNYTTSQYPVSFKDNADIENYQSYLNKKPGLVVPGGSVLRVVDVPPSSLSPMHRTVSLDYGVVLEGTMWLELDSGERRMMHRGDISIQRGTIHAWRNASDKDWARMLYVLLESEAVEIDGHKLGEDYGNNMPDNVRASS
jgi:quercetin dioxygenase-like cupin family protein